MPIRKECGSIPKERNSITAIDGNDVSKDYPALTRGNEKYLKAIPTNIKQGIDRYYGWFSHGIEELSNK